MARQKTLITSILAVQLSGFAATLSFVLLLPDSALVVVVAVMSLFGVIAAGVSSNITAKVYSHTNEGDDPALLAQMALRLLCFEKLAALVVVLGITILGLEALRQVHWLELLLLALLANPSSTSAFAKHRDVYLIRLNYIRVATTVLRAGAIHAAVWLGVVGLVPVIVIASLAPIFGYALAVTLACASTPPAAPASVMPWPVALREYLLGVPVSLVRSAFNQGVILLAVEILSPQDLRIFRFLLLPRDMFTRIFNAALPIVFDKMYLYRLTTVVTGGIMVSAAGLGAAWFWLGTLLVGSAWQPLVAYMAFLAFYATVYSVLPVMWRAVYRNRALQNMLGIFFTASLTAVTYFLLQPNSLQGIFAVISLYYLGYILSMLVIFRFESKGEVA